MNWLDYKTIWIYSEPIDFRKQINGLIGVVLSEGNQEPNDGSLYVFRNKQSNKVKLLVWDRNGYFLGYKRLAKGRFDFPVSEDGGIQLTKEELFNLVSGMPMVDFKAIKKAMFYH
jgi:transposase|tara:strand:+ start:585 stop:929 length:345 start_codon:yes stop_codon:yes gene_type:complete